MNLFQKYLAEEFVEEYQEGRISRREAMRLILSVTGSIVVANSLLAACAPVETDTPAAIAEASSTAAPQTEATDAGLVTGTDTPAPDVAPTETLAADTAATEATPAGEVSSVPVGTVSPDDPDVSGQVVTFPGSDGATLTGYYAVPVRERPYAAVLVCHENRGLTAHIEDVVRRLSKAGYTALAVDLLSRQGGTAAVGNDNVPGALGNIDPDQFVQDFRSGMEYLRQQQGVQVERLGMVGFCFGGGVTWRAATQIAELRAAVPFYGPHPPVEDVPNIQAAVLAIYGELDARINAGIPTIEAAMLENNKIFEKEIYAGADHAFHNDTSSRYHAEAARQAWTRTLEWFAQYLSA